MDFREVKGRFNHIVSVELLDSLIQGDLPDFFKVCNRSLKPQGKMVHQVLLSPESMALDKSKGDWVQKYMTPGTLTPSLSDLIKASNQKSEFNIINMLDMGQDYCKTFAAWRKKFHDNYEKLEKAGYDESFLRTWDYFLAYAQAANAMGAVTCAQITMNRLSDLR